MRVRCLVGIACHKEVVVEREGHYKYLKVGGEKTFIWERERMKRLDVQSVTVCESRNGSVCTRVLCCPE